MIKSVSICAVSLAVVMTMAADTEMMPQHLSLGKDWKGTFATTNSTSVPFFFISTNLNLSGMVGAKRDTNLISPARFELVTQFVPSMELVDGRPAPTGYVRISGRYAVIEGRTLALTSFEMHLSDEPTTKDQIVYVHSETCAFQVSADFADECRRLQSGP